MVLTLKSWKLAMDGLRYGSGDRFQRYAPPEASAKSANSGSCQPQGSCGKSMRMKPSRPAAAAGSSSFQRGRITSARARRMASAHQSRKLREARKYWMRFIADGCDQALLRKERFLRCTESSEMAAGVTPGMRAAWPKVAGRTCSSFWRTSLDRPDTMV